MIKSDAQLSRTKAQIGGFNQAIIEMKKNESNLPEDALNAAIASYHSMIAKLQAEVDDYKEIKQGKIHLPRLLSPRDLGKHLVKFRIALGISQEQLAEIVGVTRQTMNKHEEQEYQLASIDLITRVIDALGLLPEIHIKHQTLEIKQPASAT